MVARGVAGAVPPLRPIGLMAVTPLQSSWGRHHPVPSFLPRAVPSRRVHRCCSSRTAMARTTSGRWRPTAASAASTHYSSSSPLTVLLLVVQAPTPGVTRPLSSASRRAPPAHGLPRRRRRARRRARRRGRRHRARRARRRAGRSARASSFFRPRDDVLLPFVTVLRRPSVARTSFFRDDLLLRTSSIREDYGL